jgi:hypothetical protein
MKHTSAPWRQLVTRIDDARGYQICHVDLHGKSEAERDANRRLIAAAPDLLEALKYLTQIAWTSGGEAGPEPLVYQACQRAKVAIDKATLDNAQDMP